MLVLAAATRPGVCQGVAAGRAAFEECRSCHELDPAAGAAAGPNLAGLIGRPIAGDPGYGYSPALEQAGRGGARWTRETLERYLEDPEAVVPGTWMTARVRDAAERRALIDFLSDPNAR